MPDHTHVAGARLTFTDGVRILPGLIILAEVFTAPHYIRPAGREEKRVTETDGSVSCTVLTAKELSSK